MSVPPSTFYEFNLETRLGQRRFAFRTGKFRIGPRNSPRIWQQLRFASKPFPPRFLLNPFDRIVRLDRLLSLFEQYSSFDEYSIRQILDFERGKIIFFFFFGTRRDGPINQAPFHYGGRRLPLSRPVNIFDFRDDR